jgi:hypothetical protein
MDEVKFYIVENPHKTSLGGKLNMPLSQIKATFIGSEYNFDKNTELQKLILSNYPGSKPLFFFSYKQPSFTMLHML